MARPFIVTGLDGLIVNSDIFSKAHEAWFDHFCSILGDNSFKDLMHKPNYWDAVYEIMERQLGLSRKVPDDAEMLRKFARETYRSLVIKFAEQYKKRGELSPGEHGKCIETLRSMKDRFFSALLTTMPQDGTLILVAKAKCLDIYDTVLGSRVNEFPSAGEIFDRKLHDCLKMYRFICKTSGEEIEAEDYDKIPACYIGTGKKTIKFFKEQGVLTILTYWHDYLDGYKGSDEAAEISDYVVTNANQMKEILENEVLKPSQ